MSRDKESPRLRVAKTYKLFIGGGFPRSESGRYFALASSGGKLTANVSRASRKDFREAVVAARAAQPSWAASSAYLRGQIVYRIAEMLEDRASQFITELREQGRSQARARAEVQTSIDRLVYFAGWADKYQQVFSSVNPVASSHFCFSMLEPMGVIAVLAPERSALLGLVTNVATAIVGGNTVVALASEARPLSAISFAEVLQSSDVPDGVVNLLTGYRTELAEHFASHMDVNALVCCDVDVLPPDGPAVGTADNIKRLIDRTDIDWRTSADPYLIRETQEIKTTWHPISR
ncbi:MAG: aldehyde dehydrogenase family protein [Pseudomonadota bacterium]